LTPSFHALWRAQSHATNKLGKNVSTTSGVSGIFGVRKIDVSNSLPHFEQAQRWVIWSSFTYVDRFGAVSHCPQDSHLKDCRSDAIVVMSTSQVILFADVHFHDLSASQFRNTMRRDVGTSIAPAVSKELMVRDTVSTVRPR
jgi:hypothetical protein